MAELCLKQPGNSIIEIDTYDGFIEAVTEKTGLIDGHGLWINGVDKVLSEDGYGFWIEGQTKSTVEHQFNLDNRDGGFVM